MYKTENVKAELFLINDYDIHRHKDYTYSSKTVVQQQQRRNSTFLGWYRDYQTSFHQSVILDRHYLYEIESKTRIASIASIDRNDDVPLILARDFKLFLNFRELPVSLLRLYFLGQHKFDHWLNQLPAEAIDELYHILKEDGYEKEHIHLHHNDENDDNDEYDDDDDDEDIQEQEYLFQEARKKYSSPEDQEKLESFINRQRKLKRIKKYLILVFDLCFSSFEKCLHGIISILLSSSNKRSSSSPRRLNKWPSFGLFDNLANAKYFRNVPNPFGRGSKRPNAKDLLHSSKLLWLVCMWRINVIHMIGKKLKPWLYQEELVSRQEDEKDILLLRMRLFGDTHLDLLTEMYKNNIYNDDLLKSRNILNEAYPGCPRNSSVDELPDLTSYVFENLKNGTNLKDRCSPKDKMGHLFFMKAMNNICKIRNLHKIIERYGITDPIIIEKLKYVCKCIMLGNLPKMKGSMCLLARIIINFSFYSENTDKPDESGYIIVNNVDADEEEEEEEEEGELEQVEVELNDNEQREVLLDENLHTYQQFTNITKTAKKTTATKRKKKKKKKKKPFEEVSNLKKSTFITWIYKYRHLVSFILKEYAFYIVESSGCFHEILGCNNKFVQYTKIGRMAMGRFRDEFSSQCTADPPSHLQGDELNDYGLTINIDWTKIENVYKLDKYTIKSGIILNFHTTLLKTAQKVKKGPFEEILAKKMTGSEEDMTIDEAKIKMNNTCSLDDMHFLAWYIANHTNILETRWFQCIGMTEVGVYQLRDWQYCYYIFDIPDDSYKDYIVSFQERSMSDYIILKTMIKLIMHYRRDYVFHLPYSHALRQIQALRGLLVLDDLSSTPPLLGTAYECSGCLKFANPIVHPVNPADYYPYDENNVTGFASSTLTPSSITSTNNASTANYQLQQKAKIDLMYQNTLPCLNSTLYNIYNGKLYCARKPNKNLRKRSMNHAIKSFNEEYHHHHDDNIEQQHDDADNDENLMNPVEQQQRRQKSHKGILKTPPSRVIMASSDGTITIESNKAIVKHSRVFDKSPFLSPSLQRIQRNHDDGDGSVDGDEMNEEFEEDDVREEEEDNENDTGVIRFDCDNDITNLSFSMTPSEMVTFFKNRSQNLMPENSKDSLKKKTHHHTTTSAASDTTSEGKTNVEEGTRKKFNKTIVNKYTNAPIQKYFSCQTPLNPINMIGIIKNGKVLCIECGSMTVAKNYNMTSHGFSCTRKISPSLTKDHPVWVHDKSSVKYTNLKLTPNYNNNNLFHQQQQDEITLLLQKKQYHNDMLFEDESDNKDDIDYFLTRHNLDNNDDDDDEDMLMESKFRQNERDEMMEMTKKTKNRNKKRKLTDLYHKDNIIIQSLHNPYKCQFCQSKVDLIYITTQDSQTLKIMKVPTCHQCRKSCKNLLARNRLDTLTHLKSYLSNKKCSM
jgi:hypothetical protein